MQRIRFSSKPKGSRQAARSHTKEQGRGGQTSPSTRFRGGCCPASRGIIESVRSLDVLNQELIACRRCPRLVEHCQTIAREKRRAYLEWEYWGRPVPGFGDPNARVLVLGLAPGAHGSNRTGRMFTGDSSGYFFYRVLHQTGFANLGVAARRDDGLKLKDLYITAAVRCAPPQNKPTPQEITNCSDFLDRELALLKRVRIVVPLGRIGFEAYLNHLKRRGLLTSKAPYQFAHGAQYDLPDGRILLASYHPSNQNTQTGKLTEAMFREVFERARRLVNSQNGNVSCRPISA